MPENKFSLTQIQGNIGQRKPVFCYLIGSV